MAFELARGVTEVLGGELGRGAISWRRHIAS
jgi:hypothetical protein